MLLEFCAENFTKIPEAIDKGIHRIELCDNLAAGGTTPSYAVIEHTIKYAKEKNVQVATMVRPRGGNFIYHAEEFEMMKKDLQMIKELNSDGVVFGCLNENKRIDRVQTKQLIERSGEMETVFHMAFDEIPKEHQKEELDWLISEGITRILTHGGREGTIWDNATWLEELITYADNRVEILIGGGVNYKNWPKLAEEFSTHQFHGTQIVNFEK